MEEFKVREPNRLKKIFLKINAVCPHCNEGVAFEAINVPDKFEFFPFGKTFPEYEKVFSARRCPLCLGIVFLVSKIDFKTNESCIVGLYPTHKPVFNERGLSILLAELFSECIACYHAGLYRASAIMLRRCLEQICDENSVKGRNLHERLEKLKTKISIHPQLYDALIELKALGNDAAHVRLDSFDHVGQKEVNLGIEIFKKVIDSFYQTEILLNELKSLKKQA